jgi:uncharacterized protein YndB with AHSA1/START domain
MSDRPSFVYVTYIATTPEKLWRALTDGTVTREYWGGRTIESDWKVGSPFLLRKQDGSGDGAHGVVLEAEPPHKLVLSWGFARPGEAAPPASRVTFTIEKTGPADVKLRVVHEAHEPGSRVDEQVREGWSAILSSLKTLLETGQALEVTRRWAASGR